MHASIRKYKIDTDSVVALAVRVEDGFIPIISKLPGFVSYMVIDAGDGVPFLPPGASLSRAIEERGSPLFLLRHAPGRVTARQCRDFGKSHI